MELKRTHPKATTVRQLSQSFWKRILLRPTRAARAWVKRRHPFPVFVISYNRGAFLLRVIRSYQRQSIPTEIIVHDFGSDDPATLQTLAQLEQTGISVVRSSKIHSGEELNHVDESVQNYFRNAEPCRYVVTDCDIDLTIASPDSLTVYDELLDRFPNVECVGPMLRIIDVPPAFPLYNRVMNRHIEQFWQHEPQWLRSKTGETVAYLPALIDTTFALHRANEPFRRLKNGLRVYYPYEAQHLDWYQLPDDLLNSAYFQGSRQGIGNWSNKSSHALYQSEELRFIEASYVDRDSMGRLVCRVWTLDDSAGW